MALLRNLRNQNAGLLFLSVLLVLGFVMTGCASSPKVKPKLVEQYQQPVAVDENETLVYVIRQSAFAGSAQQVWVGCNDEFKAQIASGTYCFFKVPADINTINLRQMQIPFGFFQVDFRPGETVFLFFETKKGQFHEVDQDLGKTLVMESSLSKPYKGDHKNTDFEIGLMNPGFVNLHMMKPSETPPIVDDGHAVVTFLRPQKFIGFMSFGIWNQDGLLGNLKGQTCFSVKLTPERHTFIANSRYYSALTADLEPGRHYYVVVEASRGWSQANINFEPVAKDVRQSTIEKWLKSCTAVTLDQDAVNEKVRKRLDAALPLVKRTVEQVTSGGLKAQVLQ